MPQVKRSALVMYSAQQMYDLVNDVNQYPQFLPDCDGATVLAQTDTSMTAKVKIAKGAIQKWFTTSNQLQPGKSIHMTLVDGPFRSLVGGWTFTPLDDKACKVELNLDFEFSSKVVELAFGKVFGTVTSNMINAFTQRAKVVYGN